MKPDASKHNPDPAYIRALVEATGRTQAVIAKRLLGVSLRSLKQYVAPIGRGHSDAPYGVQFMLESEIGPKALAAIL